MKPWILISTSHFFHYLRNNEDKHWSHTVWRDFFIIYIIIFCSIAHFFSLIVWCMWPCTFKYYKIARSNMDMACPNMSSIINEHYLLIRKYLNCVSWLFYKLWNIKGITGVLNSLRTYYYVSLVHRHMITGISKWNTLDNRWYMWYKQ